MLIEKLDAIRNNEFLYVNLTTSRSGILVSAKMYAS